MFSKQSKLATDRSIVRRIVIACAAIVVLLSGIPFARVASAAPSNDTHSVTSGQRLITIHDDGDEKSLLTDKTTLRAAFKDAKIHIDPNDRIEPGLDESLVARNYEVNIYRARPILIRDGEMRHLVMSAYRTPEQIARGAAMTIHDEDVLSMGLTKGDSAVIGTELSITRATPFSFVLFGKKLTAYTQQKTVGDMLKDKNVTLNANDGTNLPLNTAITPNMSIEVWRNGKQTITEDESVAFAVEQIQDADRPVGYKDIKTPGANGQKSVTYEVEMRNGVEISRKEINSLTTKQPIKQVEVVGAKPTFDGDFAAALAKLRSCEGNYNSWNPAGYYGAYQFDRGTWASSAPAGAEYGNATPAEQDQAARNLYERRGWQPWPNCGRGLPDTFR